MCLKCFYCSVSDQAFILGIIVLQIRLAGYWGIIQITRVYTCIHVHVHVYTCIHVYTCTCIVVYTYVHVHVYMCMHGVYVVINNIPVDYNNGVCQQVCSRRQGLVK